MAKPKGMISLKGTINDINFYYLNGKAVARAAGGGFNRESIKKSPKMVRVRENSSEFGMVSKAKKLIRLGLYPFLHDFKDVTLHARMMRLFQEIKTLDTVSERGQRTFQKGLATNEGRSLLVNFAITQQKASIMLPGHCVFDAVAQKYTVSNITPSTLRLPKGATGMKVCLGILEADLNAEVSKLFVSDVVSIDANYGNTSFVLTPEPLPTADGVRIAVLQVRYYQEVGGKVFLFNELKEQGLEIVGVY